jgi:hypothetical protein
MAEPEDLHYRGQKQHFLNEQGKWVVEKASLCKKNSVIEFLLSLMCTVLQKEVGKISDC